MWIVWSPPGHVLYSWKTKNVFSGTAEPHLLLSAGVLLVGCFAFHFWPVCLYVQAARRADGSWRFLKTVPVLAPQKTWVKSSGKWYHSGREVGEWETGMIFLHPLEAFWHFLFCLDKQWGLLKFNFKLHIDIFCARLCDIASHLVFVMVLCSSHYYTQFIGEVSEA